MKRHSLLVATVFTLAVTGIMFLNMDGSAAHRPTGNRVAAARPINPCQDPAARTWLHVQPNHWRDCILQH